jgi:hypothetical protein
MESEPPKNPDLPEEKTGSEPDHPVEQNGFEAAVDDDDSEEIMNESNLSQIKNVVNENKIK